MRQVVGRLDRKPWGLLDRGRRGYYGPGLAADAGPAVMLHGLPSLVSRAPKTAPLMPRETRRDSHIRCIHGYFGQRQESERR
jgi:hypothetical protein